MSQEPNIPAVDGVQKPSTPATPQTFADLGVTGPIVGALPSEAGRGPTPFYSGSITSQPIEDGTEGRAFGQQAFPVSTLQGGIADFTKQLEFGSITSNLIAGARFHYDKEFDPDAVPQLIQRRKVLIEDLNRRISQSTPGLRAGAFRWGMAALGQLADPLQLAVIAGTDGLLGLGSKAMMDAITEHVIASPRLARVLTGALKGSITGATFGAVQGGSHLAIAHGYEDDYTTLDMLQQIGVYSAFGGVLEGFGGLIHVTPTKPLTKEGTLDEPTTPIQPIDQNDYRTILQSAISQVSNDNYVDIGALVQQGIKNGRLNDNIEDLPIIAQNLQQLPKDLAAKEQQIKDFQEKIGAPVGKPREAVAPPLNIPDNLDERLEAMGLTKEQLKTQPDQIKAFLLPENSEHFALRFNRLRDAGAPKNSIPILGRIPEVGKSTRPPVDTFKGIARESVLNDRAISELDKSINTRVSEFKGDTPAIAQIFKRAFVRKKIVLQQDVRDLLARTTEKAKADTEQARETLRDATQKAKITVDERNTEVKESIRLGKRALRKAKTAFTKRTAGIRPELLKPDRKIAQLEKEISALQKKVVSIKDAKGIAATALKPFKAAVEKAREAEIAQKPILGKLTKLGEDQKKLAALRIERTALTKKLNLKKLLNLHEERDQISAQLDANKVASDLMLQRIPPVTGIQANDLGQKMFSTENESPLITNDDSLTQEVSKESDEPSTLLKDDEDDVNQKLKDGELTDEDTDLINEVNEELELQAGYTKLIKSIVNCLSEETI